MLPLLPLLPVLALLALLALLAIAVAIAAPTLLAFNRLPMSTLYNQTLALAGWGLCLLWLAASLAPEVPEARSPGGGAAPPPSGPRSGLAALPKLHPRVWGLSAFGLLGLTIGVHIAIGWTPGASGAAALGLLAAAALMFGAGCRLARSPRREAVFLAVCLGWLVAGLGSVAIGAVQFFAPHWADGFWVAQMQAPGRAIGNLRQPNQLGTLLLLACAALPPWWSRRRMPGWLALVGLWALLGGIALTGSRTGALGVLLLAAWGALDRSLDRRQRLALMSAPLVFLLCWWALGAWAQWAGQAFYGQARLQHRDVSSSRFAIWSNTLELIRAHPWAGVGFGQFNFAWTLTAFPGRPTEFFDHTHNLVLNVAVELGLPLASALLALLAGSLWRTRAALRSPGASDIGRCAFVMLAVVGTHSMLEYPLWYAYFLLPTAFVFGLFVGLGAVPDPGRGGGDGAADMPARGRRARWGLGWALGWGLGGGLLIVAAVLATWDYGRVVPIYRTDAGARSLEQRMVQGQRSWLFAPYADYAVVTTAPRPSEHLAAFEGALHQLIDARLLVAYATALAERGEVVKAKFVVQRLREFQHPLGTAFLSACERTPGETAPPPQDAATVVGRFPFLCDTAPVALTFKDFRP